MKANIRRRATLWSSIALALGLPALACAQTSTSAPAASTQEPATLAEIVVTAQRRAENVAKVPIAVAVVSADELAAANITTEQDLRFATPGLTVRGGVSSNEVNYAIRGESLDQYSASRPGVMPYINDVQVSANTGGGSGATAFYDLDSIQVLKGPQGTLFGRNATGGAVLFTTAKPTSDFSGYASALAGNFSTTQLEGALNLPVVQDTVLLRVAGFFSHQKGYQENVYYDSNQGDSRKAAGRVSLTLKPAPGLTNDLVVDYFNLRGSNIDAVLWNLDMVGPVPVPFLYSPANPGPPATPISWSQYLAAHPNPQVDPLGIGHYLSVQQQWGPYKIAVTAPENVAENRNLLVTNTTTWELGGDTKLKNIFGYARVKTFSAYDSSGAPYLIAALGAQTPQGYGIRSDAKILSEELQLQGTALAGNLNYTAGFYYADEKTPQRRVTSFFDILGGAMQVNDNTIKNTTYAAYAQGTYKLDAMLEGLSATAGVRYNNEKVERIESPDDSYYPLSTFFPDVYFPNQAKKFNNVSWTFGVQQQLTSETMLYAKTSRSYRNGGFNATLPAQYGYADTGGDEYKSEQLTDAELGVKFQGKIAEMPARLNFDVYNNWINDSQRTAFGLVLNGPAALTANVPKSRVTGAEFDAQVYPTSWLNVGGTLSYMNARVTDGNTSVTGGSMLFATTPDTPKWVYSLYGQVDIPLNDRFTLTLRGDGFHQDETWITSTGNLNPGARLPGYFLADFRVGLADTQNGWTVTANVKNAFDRTYYVGGLALAQLIDYNLALPGMPRTYMFQARYNFGK